MYVVSVPPIDWYNGTLTETEFFKQELEYKTEMKVELEKVKLFLTNKLKEKIRTVFITTIPFRDKMHLMYIIKADNNGTTYIFSTDKKLLDFLITFRMNDHYKTFAQSIYRIQGD